MLWIGQPQELPLKESAEGRKLSPKKKTKKKHKVSL